MQIALADLDSPGVQELVRLHLEGMHDDSPPESIHALGLAGLRSPEVTVWSASDGGHVLGIGALRVESGASEGEIKSMRTDPRHVGRGVGRGILRAIIDEATGRGLHRLSLETGATESFGPAHRLYLSEGFEPCGPFGSYGEDPFSRFFTLSLPR
jgi:putative acetyltransferase